MNKYCLLLQGPLYPNSMAGLKKMCNGLKNVIISTWIDEPTEYVNELKELGYEIVINTKPQNPGFQNINLANTTICSGLIRAKELNYTHALRFRTDFIMNDIDKFMKICMSISIDQLIFLTWYNGYLMDHVIFGPIDLLYDYRKPVQQIGDNRYAEFFLQEEYFGKRNVTYNDIKDKVKLCFRQIIDNNIKLYTTKLYNYPGFNPNDDFIHLYLMTGQCVFE